MTEENQRLKIRGRRTGDPASLFHSLSPKEILDRLGPPRTLLSSSSKAEKSVKVGVLNRVMYLTSGVLCGSATPGCLAACLGHSSGRMRMPTSVNARDRRTALFMEDREHFVQLLRADLFHLRSEAKHWGMIPAARLNGTSDVPWERIHGELFEEFGDIQFFDYTKLFTRMMSYLTEPRGKALWHSNYHLTFSLSETNGEQVLAVLAAGGSVAVVFDGELPAKWHGYQVINGDDHDARFLDPTPCVVGLVAKGEALNDRSGFVVIGQSGQLSAA